MNRALARRCGALVATAVLGLASCGGPPPAKPSGDPAGEAPQSSSPSALPGDAKGASSVKPGDANASAGGVPEPAVAGGLGGYAHVWTSETKDWNNALLLSKDGDLLSFSQAGIRVHARDDGRVLHQRPSCAPVSAGGVAFMVDDRFVVVCDRELRAFSWPRLDTKKMVSFSTRVDGAAIAANLVAVSEDGFFAPDKKGKIRLYLLSDGSPVDELVPPGEVETLALSSDAGKLYVGTREGKILIRDLRTKADQLWTDMGDGEGASFAPDGQSVFAFFGSFEAARVDLGTKKKSKTWEVRSWLTASRWIDRDTVAATGGGGLVLYPTAGAPLPAPIPDLGEGLALSKDAATLCAGGREGRIACFGKVKPAPTTLAGAWGSSSR